MADAQDEYHVFRRGVRGTIGKNMKDEVDIQPDSQQYESSDEEHVPRHLPDEERAFFAVLLFDSACQLRRSDSRYGAAGHTHHHCHIGSDSEDAGAVQTHLRCDEERRESRRQHGGQGGDNQEPRVDEVPADEGAVIAQKRHVRTQPGRVEREKIAEVDNRRYGIVAAKPDNEPVQREDAESVEQIQHQQPYPHHQLTHRTRHNDVHQHIAGGLTDALVKHEKGDGQYEIIVLNKERRLVSEPCAQRHTACPIEHRKDDKSGERHQHRPEEETVVGIAVFMPEIRVETDNAGIGAQLRQTNKECRRINKHPRQPDFLCCEETGQHEERGNHAHGNAQISHYRAAYRLFGDNAHN